MWGSVVALTRHSTKKSLILQGSQLPTAPSARQLLSVSSQFTTFRDQLRASSAEKPLLARPLWVSYVSSAHPETSL